MTTPREIEIDGARYLIGRLPPRRALKLQNRLIRCLGPAVVALFKNVPTTAEGKADFGSLDHAAVGAALQGLMSQLTPQEQDDIMVELLSTVQVVGAEKVGPVMPIFDSHFDGRLVAVWKLLWACLEEQFGGFFALFAAAARAAGFGVARSTGSITSTTSGPSGASS
jgi:hypothetical protein